MALGIQAVAVQGTLLQVGNGQSPESFTTIVNIDKFTLPLKARTVDVSNISSIWMQQIPTLLEIGNLQVDIFWVPEEPSHSNAPGGGSVAAGLRNLFRNKTLKNWQIIYNDGNNSTDAFQAYVTSYAITGQTANVLRATITLSGTATPQLV
jgi:hypothetical protein